MKASKIRSKCWEDPVEVLSTGASNKAGPTKTGCESIQDLEQELGGPSSNSKNRGQQNAGPTKPGCESVQEKENYE